MTIGRSRRARAPIDLKRLGDEIAKASSARGLYPGPATVELLVRHLALLLAWNRRFSLTAITDEGEAVRRHVVESLEGAAALAAGPEDLLVDLGSGTGYPALPLLTVWPETRGELMEGREVKAAFLRAALRETGLARRVEVRREHLGDPAVIRADATIVTLRAFPEPGRWIEGALGRPSVRAVLARLAAADAAAIANALPAGTVVRLRPLETGALLSAAKP